jgi:azurin
MQSPSRLLLAILISAHTFAAEKKEPPLTPGGVYRAHDMQRPRPPVITPPGFSTQQQAGAPPSDAIILFDGKDLSKWKSDPRKDTPPGDDKPRWKVENGHAEITPKAGGIRTREKFKGDYQLHIEWRTPDVVSGKGQGRGNSGVFIGGFPEIQVLDSHENDTYPDGQAAGLYSHYPPMVNASRKPGEWQSYDILFERARPGAKARLTVIHNGVVVHYLREFDSSAQEGDIALQDHNNPVRYRNIWLRPLRVDSDAKGTKPPAAAKPISPISPIPSKPKTTTARTIKLKTMTAQMKYDESEFTVRPGESVRLLFENGDDLPHNIVFCQPGTDTAAMAMKQMENAEAALKRNWLPDDPRIWAHSRMLNPHESEEIAFTAPEKPGDYPYVCTFPGHALTMKGIMKVLPLGEGLRDLRFALYLGKWESLPDFTKLKPHRVGPVPENLIDIKLDDYKHEFGVVFTGKLNAPRKGSYRFYIAGDDGVRLLIDGKKVVEHDGIHPASDIKEAGVPLEQGEHEFRLEYFQGTGDIAVFAAWKGSNFDVTPLSKWMPNGWEKGAKGKRQKDFPPIPLVVRDEPVIYRNFIAGAGNRGIAVGYPGGVNIAWSAESMSLALLWRGAFMDASRHWNSRGSGREPPLGYDVIAPTGEQPAPAFFITENPAANWPAWDIVKRFEGYEWQGYTLDEKRAPTFRYTWNGVSVQETFTATAKGSHPDARASLTRRITLGGTLPANAWLRLAHASSIKLKDGTFRCEEGNARFSISLSGAQIAGKNLVLPVSAPGEIIVTYQWVD